MLCLLALRQSSEVDLAHYIGNELTFLGYDVKSGAVSDILATRATNRPKVGRPAVLDVPGREVA